MKYLVLNILILISLDLIAKDEIKGILISDENIAVGSLTLEIPIYSISVKSNKNGSFKITLPDKLQHNEDIYIYLKSNKWQMIEPVQGEYVIVKPHQRVSQLIIKLKTTKRVVPPGYNKEQSIARKDKLTEKSIIQIQVGSNNDSDFSSNRTIQSEINRLSKITGYKVKHFRLDHGNQPHKFLIDQIFSKESNALKIKDEIRKSSNNEVQAHLYNHD